VRLRVCGDLFPDPAPDRKIVLVVSDLEASIKFYTEAFGLKLLRKRALLPHQAALFGILGYSEEADATLLASPEGADALASPRIELRYIYNNERVDSGVGLEDITFLAADPAALASGVPALGGNVTSVENNVAKLLDPDGYKINVCADVKDLD
jgi:lactoylglutathione lyase